MTLDRAGFAADHPVVVANDLSRIEFALENRAGGAHATALTISGLPEGDYRVSVAGAPVAVVTDGRRTVRSRCRSEVGYRSRRHRAPVKLRRTSSVPGF